MDNESGVYGNSPFTLQTGGCGEPGQFIQVSASFLSSMDTANKTFGPPGQVFVHEWAKYRYGVFEEYGYPGDNKYPMFYYKPTWTVNGQENRVTPNFCTNSDINDFDMVDASTGGACSYDRNTGLPDHNCVAIVGKSNSINSSIMAIPYLENNDQFCDDTEELFHLNDIPTKQNEMCNGRSTFAVIKEHQDFLGFEERNKTQNTVPEIKILRSIATNSFVMVLDASKSMGANCKDNPDPNCELRVDRMKQSAKRWIEYDISENVPVGLVIFSNTSTELFPLTPINRNNRDEFIEKLMGIELTLKTCLGDALREGLALLRRGGVPTGGVMLFLTDGKFSCKGEEDTSTIQEVIPEVKEQGVRVITIAFSNDADPDLVELAEETDGKAYFVPDDSGPETINTAMQGALTYQPSVPTNDIDIIIFESTFSHFNNSYFEFTVDELIGKNLTVQIDISGIADVTTILIDNQRIERNESGTVEYEFPGIKAPGIYPVQIKSSKQITFASVKITGKSVSDKVPIMTECWTSFGNKKVDLSNPEMKIAVIAKVLQGTNPVIGARVTAYIEREGSPQPIEITLFDQGSEPDSIANDGIYTRYFTSFDPNKDNTRYSLKCQVEGTDDSSINEGFIDARNNLRSLPAIPSPANPICCGSDTLRDDSILTPTGDFSRSAPGGSVEIVNADKVDYPPGRVADLRAGNNLNMTSFSLFFTSTGNHLDAGTAKSLSVMYSQNITDLDSNSSFLLTKEDVLNPIALEPAQAGTKVEIQVKRILSNNDTFAEEQQYFFGLLVRGETNKTSISNIASVYFPKQIVESGSNYLVFDGFILVMSIFFCSFVLS